MRARTRFAVASGALLVSILWANLPACAQYA